MSQSGMVGAIGTWKREEGEERRGDDGLGGGQVVRRGQMQVWA